MYPTMFRGGKVESREQGGPEGTNLASTVNGCGRHFREDRALDAILNSVAYGYFGCSCERNAGSLADMSAHRVLVGIPGTLGACSVSHGKL